MKTADPAALADEVAERASLYRYFDKDERLLYVGITSAGLNRSNQHAKSSPWWHLATHSQVEHFPTIRQARQAETSSIAFENPLFNVAGTPRRRSRANRSATAAPATPTIVPTPLPLRGAIDEAEERLVLAAQELVAALMAIVHARPSVVVDSRAPVLFSVPEAARRLGISRSTAYLAVADGSLKTVRVRGRRLVGEPEIARIARTA